MYIALYIYVHVSLCIAGYIWLFIATYATARTTEQCFRSSRSCSRSMVRAALRRQGPRTIKLEHCKGLLFKSNRRIQSPNRPPKRPQNNPQNDPKATQNEHLGGSWAALGGSWALLERSWWPSWGQCIVRSKTT